MNVRHDNVDGWLLSFLLMWALRRVMTWLLTVKTMNTQLTSVRPCQGYWHQLLFLLLLGTWWFGPCGTWPSAVVVGWPSSLLAYVLRPVVPLVISWVPSVGVKFVAIIVTTIIIVPIVIVVAMVVVVSAIVITAAIVIFPTIVIAAPIVVIAMIVVFPIAVVILVLVSGPWPVAVPLSWSAACLGLG